MSKVTPWLWFDTEGEEAAEFYCSLFPNSRVTGVSRYGDTGPRPAGTAMTVSFELDGQPMVALNGGPDFHFTEAVSFQIDCADQDEVDRYWAALTADGGEEGPCGWAKDKFGLSWQVVPRELEALIGQEDQKKGQAAMAAMLKQTKIDLAEIRAAADSA